MHFIQIVIDFFTLGAIGLCTTVTLAIWYGFCNVFIFEQGYLAIIDKYKPIKVALVLISGFVIWGTLLLKVHEALWKATEVAPIMPPLP